MISQIETEMVKAKAMVTVTALLLALALTNPSTDDYRLWNHGTAASRVNLVLASLYDGHVLAIGNFFFSL